MDKSKEDILGALEQILNVSGEMDDDLYYTAEELVLKGLDIGLHDEISKLIEDGNNRERCEEISHILIEGSCVINDALTTPKGDTYDLLGFGIIIEVLDGELKKETILERKILNELCDALKKVSGLSKSSVVVLSPYLYRSKIIKNMTIANWRQYLKQLSHWMAGDSKKGTDKLPTAKYNKVNGADKYWVLIGGLAYNTAQDVKSLLEESEKSTTELNKMLKKYMKKKFAIKQLSIMPFVMTTGGLEPLLAKLTQRTDTMFLTHKEWKIQHPDGEGGAYIEYLKQWHKEFKKGTNIVRANGTSVNSPLIEILHESFDFEKVKLYGVISGHTFDQEEAAFVVLTVFTEKKEKVGVYILWNTQQFDMEKAMKELIESASKWQLSKIHVADGLFPIEFCQHGDISGRMLDSFVMISGRTEQDNYECKCGSGKACWQCCSVN